MYDHRLEVPVSYAASDGDWKQVTLNGPGGAEYGAKVRLAAYVFVGLAGDDGALWGWGAKLSEHGKLEDGKWEDGFFTGEGVRRDWAEDGTAVLHAIGTWHTGILNSGMVTRVHGLTFTHRSHTLGEHLFQKLLKRVNT